RVCAQPHVGTCEQCRSCLQACWCEPEVMISQSLSRSDSSAQRVRSVWVQLALLSETSLRGPCKSYPESPNGSRPGPIGQNLIPCRAGILLRRNLSITGIVE